MELAMAEALRLPSRARPAGDRCCAYPTALEDTPCHPHKKFTTGSS